VGSFLQSPVAAALIVLLVALAAAAFGSLVLRFRRSRGEERQQLKWFTYAATLVPLSVVADALPAPVGDLATALPIVFLPPHPDPRTEPAIRQGHRPGPTELGQLIG
jgi:hypothetical protein